MILISEISLPFTRPGNIINKFLLRFWANQRGRGWVLKKLVNIFPGLNNARLAFASIELPLDLRNDGDIGYFYGQGISHEKFYQEILIHLINEKTIFYDIGSNLGYYSLLLSAYVNKVYAFEPNPILVNRLKSVISVYSIANIKIFNIGVSGRNSVLPFYYDPSRHNLGSFVQSTGSSNQIEVEVKTLNDIIINNGLKIPDIIKIDTEGLELDILEGYTMILTHKPIIFIEWMPDPMEEESLFLRLLNILDHQYKIFRIGVNDGLTLYPRKNDLSNNLLLVPEGSYGLGLIEKWIK